MVLSEKELIERDAQRDIGAELLAAVRDVKAGRYGDSYQVVLNDGVEASGDDSASQLMVAELLGDSGSKRFE